MNNKRKPWIFAASCPSLIGTVDVVTSYMAGANNYIEEIHSFDDRESQRFFIRIEFNPGDKDFSQSKFESEFAPRAQRFDMKWELVSPQHRPKVAILVSKYDHCLNDLLFRHRTGQLDIEIPVIISNHPDLQPLAKWHDIAFHHLPITKATKPQQESDMVDLLKHYQVELVVLARYMQILSPELCEHLDGWAINIHHSLLPGFKGARPYHQAWEKGVKMVGATAHYVNNNLDEGPIIAQEIQMVGHELYPDDLVSKGQDIERVTLFNAVRHHIEKRVFINDGRTVVFSH